MTDMKITGLKKRMKGSGAYIALAVCMIGIGACGWLTIGKNATDNTDNTVNNTVDPNNSSSFIADSTSSYYETVDVGKVITNSEEEKTDNSSNSSGDDTSSEPEQMAEYFVLPLTGEILKPYSLKELQYSATFNDWRLHNALDIAAENGAVIRAASDGTVADIYDDAQLGKVIKIEHPNDIVTVYCGIKTAYVKKGETVGINQDIGNLGEIPCESADKPHLHFAVIKNGVYTSPLEVLKME